MNMNSNMHYASKEKSTALETKKGGWSYAFSQYITMLKRWGGKFVYFAQWSVFNFGFHMIICCALYKSYNHVLRLKNEIAPQTVHGGTRDEF